MKIFAQKNGTYTKNELLDLAALLVKGGYAVRRGKIKAENGKKVVEFIEFWPDTANDVPWNEGEKHGN